MALAGTTWTASPVPHRLRETLLSGVTVVVATVALASLVPAATAAVTNGSSAAAAAAQPPQVSLIGTVSTAGLPATSAVSLLAVRNDGSAAVRWSVTTDVDGAAAGVAVEVWAPDGAGCGTGARASSRLDWSRAILPAGAASPLCVRLSASGSGDGVVQPRVTVHARPA